VSRQKGQCSSGLCVDRLLAALILRVAESASASFFGASVVQTSIQAAGAAELHAKLRDAVGTSATSQMASKATQAWVRCRLGERFIWAAAMERWQLFRRF
jgi:hypothetical protein